MVEPDTHFPWFISRAKALELGFNHEGTHFGVPIWADFDESDPDVMGMVVAKWRIMEPFIDLGLLLFQIANSFRPPGEESGFPFVLRPIPQPPA